MRALLAAGLVALILGGCASNPVWWTPTHDPALRIEARERGKRACVRVGPRLDGCFDAVAMRSLALSPDGGHVAYPAKTKGRWAVVRDGIVGTGWDGVASLVFSGDGRRLAYAALDGTRWRVVVDGQPGEPHDSLIAGTLAFDPSGRRSAYGFWQDGRAHVMVDGRSGDGYGAIGRLGFNPDGSRFAYVAQNGTRATLVVDGAIFAVHDAVTEFAIGPGGLVSYAAREGDGWYVIERDRRMGPYRSVRSLAYRPSTKVLTYVARNGTGELVVSGGVEGPESETVEAPLFSRDGAHWGYLARRDEESVVVLDGTVRAREARIRALAISPDGNRFAYIAERGGSVTVVDDRGDHPFDLLIEGSLVFVRGGEAWACLAGDRGTRRLFVAVEGTSKRLPFDWDEAGRRVRRSAEPSFSAEQTRSWIRTQAERILAEEAGRARR